MIKNGLKSPANLAALSTIAIAVMGLFGYLPGMGQLGSIRESYIPMAPSTAICFILLAFLLLKVGAKPLLSAEAGTRLLVSSLVSLFGILEVAGYFSGLDLNFEDTLVPAFGSLDGIPIARMSPATGIAFFLSGVAVFLHTLQRNFLKHSFSASDLSRVSKVIDYVKGGLGTLVLLISFIFCLAYLYGTPLLYGSGSTIPMALTTALGFLCISFSILTFEQDTFPLRIVTGASTRSYLLRFMLPLATLSVIIGGVVALYSLQMTEINPAFLSAALTLVAVIISGFIATLISRHVGIKIDQSEIALKQANKALQESEQRLSLLLNTLPYGVQENDTKGVISYSNHAHHHILGFEPGELIGRRIWDFEKDEDHKQQLCDYFGFLVSEQPLPQRYVTRNITKDGREVNLEINWDYQRNDRGAVIGFISVISDITERKKLEMKLQHSQKMEALGTLAGGIAHNFNNVLNPITGYADLMRSKPDDVERNKIFAENIYRAAKNGADIVRQILAFTRHREEQLKVIELQRIIEETLGLLRATLPSNIVINPIMENIHPLILGVEAQIQQVILNLATNAFQVMEEKGGTLTISVSRYTLSEKQQTFHPKLDLGEYTKITVVDTGRGMDKRTMTRIFDPFFTTKEVGKGSGLGLSTVEGIVLAHNGDISVTSELGKGTSFEVLLPVFEEVTEREF